MGSQLIATSHTGKMGVWNAVTKHWQVGGRLGSSTGRGAMGLGGAQQQHSSGRTLPDAERLSRLAPVGLCGRAEGRLPTWSSCCPQFLRWLLGATLPSPALQAHPESRP